MDRIWKVLFSLLLAFSLAACSSRGIQQMDPSAVSSSSSTESIKPMPLASSSSHNAETAVSSSNSTQADSPALEDDADKRLIQITTADGQAVLFELNGSAAADSLYQQLPLTLTAEDYAGNEKIFYPPEKLDTHDTPLAQGPAGTLAYYAPWGDVAIFYHECGGASGLYALGEAISGIQYLTQISGEIHIEAAGGQPTAETEAGHNMRKIQIAIGNQTFTASLYDNEAAQALASMLPLTLDMSELNGNEKYYYFEKSLPANPSRPSGIHNGDLMLYGSDCLVLFYESFPTSYSYTPLGVVENPSGLASALGENSVQVTFSLA